MMAKQRVTPLRNTAAWLITASLAMASMGCAASVDANTAAANTAAAQPATNPAPHSGYARWHQPGHVQQLAVVCPVGAFWDGRACLAQHIVTDVRCPKQSEWDGTHCIATTVQCPAGSTWTDQQCVPTSSDALANTSPAPTPAKKPPPPKRLPLDPFRYP